MSWKPSNQGTPRGVMNSILYSDPQGIPTLLVRFTDGRNMEIDYMGQIYRPFRVNLRILNPGAQTGTRHTIDNQDARLIDILTHSDINIYSFNVSTMQDAMAFEWTFSEAHTLFGCEHVKGLEADCLPLNDNPEASKVLGALRSWKTPV